MSQVASLERMQASHNWLNLASDWQERHLVRIFFNQSRSMVA